MFMYVNVCSVWYDFIIFNLYFLFLTKNKNMQSQCGFEKSCATFATVFTLFVPTITSILLIIIIGIMAARKKPVKDYMWMIIYLAVLIFLMLATIALRIKLPGVLCGFFIVYLGVLFMQPIVNFGLFEKSTFN